MTSTYEDPRAHAIRERYLGIFGGPELPVPVEAIAEDLLGLRMEESRELGDCSGVLLSAERQIPSMQRRRRKRASRSAGTAYDCA